MAKPVSFSRPAKPKGGSTSFNFGANVAKAGTGKKGSVRRSQYAGGGGS